MEERSICRCNITIENHLENYAKNSEDSERYEILWHAWKHNKRWLCQLLEWIMPSYPNYSRHDETHARAVLHNIEMMLGEKEISKLSASDCFLILHVVYIHDIGMCITHKDKKELMKSKKFIGFLENISQYGETMMKKYANYLLTYCKDMPQAETEEKMLFTKLDVYYAVMYLVSEYNRKEHGENSKEMLEEWIGEPDKLGVAFSMSGIPSRFFYTIGACASVHTSYNFDDVMELHKVDGGFAHDYMHPRFAAVLLQLGDALDLDNDRFHPLIKMFLGDMPENSMTHLGKHRSIRRLFIGTDKIMIEANCPSPDVMRQVCVEYEGIRDILQKATFYWSSICPEELNACLPSLEPLVLLLNGRKVEQEIVNLKFQIKQKNAFNLLQGRNIYSDNEFVFLREIFQNAVDASKIQWWKDWKRSRWYEEDKLEIAQYISPLSYPIEIELHIAQKEKYKDEYCILGEKEYHEPIYGVLVRVIDYGVGMNAKNIQEIADAGSSHEPYDDEMPSWLRITAEFGIGLQSVFLVADYFKAYTFPRSGEKYEIVFRATGDRGSGFINVMPLDTDKKSKKYGTVIEVFVPFTKKLPYEKSIHLWTNHDPFSSEYEEHQDLCDARELAMQLAFYLDSFIGEKLFPIKLSIFDYKLPYEKGSIERIINASYEKNITNAMCKIFLDGQLLCQEQRKDSYEYEEEFVTWAYGLRKNNDNFITGSVGSECKYAVDCENIKLYLWDRKKNVYARFGIERLLALRKSYKNPDSVDCPLKTRIFYKGVFTKEVDWKMDMNLLEYIDIKEKLHRSYLAFNRADFTDEGDSYIHDEIYSRVLEMAHKALDDCEKKVEQGKNSVVDKILNQIRKLINEQKEEDKIQEAVLASIGLATFAQICGKSEFVAPSGVRIYAHWDYLLDKISRLIKEGKENETEQTWTDSTFFDFSVYNAVFPREDNRQIIIDKETRKWNIAEIVSSKHHFAIVSKRKGINGSWEEYLVYLNNEQNESNEKVFDTIKQEIIELKTVWNTQKRKKLIEGLEEYGNIFIEQASTVLREEGENQASIINQNIILNWMLENIPSIALFSNEDCTIRVNVLDLEYTDSMFFDQNTKWSIYERMNQVYSEKKIERFSTLAMTGYCQLSLRKNPANIYFVKRGQLSKIGRQYLIFPFTASTLNWLLNPKIKEEFDFENRDGMMHGLVHFFLDYEEYVSKIVEGNNIVIEGQKEITFQEIQVNNVNDLIQKLLDCLESLQDDDGGMEDVLNELQLNEERLKKILLYSIGEMTPFEQKEVGKWLKENVVPKYQYIREKGAFDSIFWKKLRYELFMRCGLLEEAKEEYQVMLRLVKYLEKEGWIHISSRQYITLYKNFLNEFIEEFYSRYLITTQQKMEEKLNQDCLKRLLLGKGEKTKNQ